MTDPYMRNAPKYTILFGSLCFLKHPYFDVSRIPRIRAGHESRHVVPTCSLLWTPELDTPFCSLKNGDFQNYMSKQCVARANLNTRTISKKSCKRLNAICSKCDIPWVGTEERIITFVL